MVHVYSRPTTASPSPKSSRRYMNQTQAATIAIAFRRGKLPAVNSQWVWRERLRHYNEFICIQKTHRKFLMNICFTETLCHRSLEFINLPCASSLRRLKYRQHRWTRLTGGLRSRHVPVPHLISICAGWKSAASSAKLTVHGLLDTDTQWRRKIYTWKMKRAHARGRRGNNSSKYASQTVIHVMCQFQDAKYSFRLERRRTRRFTWVKIP